MGEIGSGEKGAREEGAGEKGPREQRTGSQRQRPQWNTRVLLVSAAFGALTALLYVVAAPLTTILALSSPPVYALVAGIYIVPPMIARRWLGLTAGTTATALFGAVIAIPFTPLGFLVVPALGLPALAIDVTLWLARRASSRLAWTLAALAGGLVIFAISLPIIDAAILVPPVVALILVARLASYLAAAALAAFFVRGLVSAGLRAPTRLR